ncbi:MAG: ice-binding family protein [Nitrosotalea sp.]
MYAWVNNKFDNNESTITINIKTYLVMSILILSASSMAQNHAFGDVPNFSMPGTISDNFQCTVTFPTGAIDLGSNVQYPAKVYPPGIYCIDGALHIGSGPITLSGNGNHVFKINGALGQAANTDVILDNGALSSGVVWVPTGATTIGANSHLIGTVTGAPITIGANSDINGMGPATIMADKISGRSQCTVTFPTGTIDLGSNVQYPSKVYPPGVYCIDGALDIGSGPITLSGNGSHIFKINGALGQAANTDVILDDGAQVSGVIWVPTGATTIGANSHLIGTVTGAPITIGTNSNIHGMGPATMLVDKISGGSQCTVIFPTGTIDLGSNVQYPSKVYPPGVYCINGAANIGSGPITLSGNGNHVFKINGALGQAANTDVILANGALSSSVIWVPTGVITIGANSHLVGIVNGAPITIGANSDINGMGPATIMADAISDNFQCTVTFPTGAIDLGSNVLYPDKVYPPGVYCIDGALDIGSGPITLSGNGSHVFKINGALGQAANTDVILVNGAQVSSVIWIPTGATTLGINSHLIGTVNGAPITIGANSDVNGMGPAKIMADAVSGNFGILASTYTNTSPGTSIAGDLGYTTGPEVPSAISGSIHVVDFVYSQAGTAQYDAISSANSQMCTSNLGGIVDLSLVNGGVYTPGVYCTTGAGTIGAAGITLSGDGTYIFKIGGTLTTVSHSIVTLSNGAQASYVSWVPTGAATLGANTKFAGTILDASGVTIGSNVRITGSVLAFGGTVSTDADTITVPSYAMSDVTTTPSGPLYATGDTSAVPEFGTVASMILAVAIISIVAVSARTRLGIMPKY